MIMPIASLPFFLFDVFPDLMFVLLLLPILLTLPFSSSKVLLYQFGSRPTPSRSPLFGGKQNRGRGS
jgi:hypothetical protein